MVDDVPILSSGRLKRLARVLPHPTGVACALTNVHIEEPNCGPNADKPMANAKPLAPTLAA
jgi:hypothetical protein